MLENQPMGLLFEMKTLVVIQSGGGLLSPVNPGNQEWRLAVRGGFQP